MIYEQKLNAISRLVILLTTIGVMFTLSIKLLIVGFLTLMAIFLLFTFNREKLSKEKVEGFIGDKLKYNTKIINPETLGEFLKTDFDITTKNNPFGNVLLTDINDRPDRKSAPPSFNVDVSEDITTSIKDMVQSLNPDIKDTNKQLFGDLGENFYLDQSNRVFYSTSNTRVENDQSALGKWLYSGYPSGKESGIARIRDNPRYTLY